MPIDPTGKVPSKKTSPVIRRRSETDVVRQAVINDVIQGIEEILNLRVNPTQRRALVALLRAFKIA